MTLAELSAFADKHPDGAFGLFILAVIAMFIVGGIVEKVVDSIASAIRSASKR